jgi:hypothetical protein
MVEVVVVVVVVVGIGVGVDALEIAGRARVGEWLVLAQGQRLGGRLEGAGQGVVIDGLAASARGRQCQGEVAEGEALEVAQLAVL